MKVGDFRFTKHAIERALDMALDPEEIRKCLYSPEHQVPSRTYPGFMNYRYGRITCAVNERRKRVITILWSKYEDWAKDLRDIGSYDDRKYRG